MTITLYRSTRSIYLGDHLVIRWDEWSLAPVAASSWDSRGTGRVRPGEAVVEISYANLRSPAVAFNIVLPPLTKVESDRIMPSGDKIGVDAASAWYLASRGERGFRILASEDDDVAKRRSDQPSLFRDEPEVPVGAYGPARNGYWAGVGRPVLASEPGSEDPREAPEVAPDATDPVAPHGPYDDHPPSPLDDDLAGDEDAGAQTQEPVASSPVSDATPSPAAVAAPSPSGEGDVLARGVGPVRFGRESDEIKAELAAIVKRVNAVASGPRTTPQQFSIDHAAADLVASIERAIYWIREGSGVTAIAILERVGKAMTR